jgi:hypothetical protein
LGFLLIAANSTSGGELAKSNGGVEKGVTETAMGSGNSWGLPASSPSQQETHSPERPSKLRAKSTLVNGFLESIEITSTSEMTAKEVPSL